MFRLSNACTRKAKEAFFAADRQSSTHPPVFHAAIMSLHLSGNSNSHQSIFIEFHELPAVSSLNADVSELPPIVHLFLTFMLAITMCF